MTAKERLEDVAHKVEVALHAIGRDDVVVVVDGAPDESDPDHDPMEGQVMIDGWLSIDPDVMKRDSISGVMEVPCWRVVEWEATPGTYDSPPDCWDKTLAMVQSAYEAAKIAVMRIVEIRIENAFDADAPPFEFEEWESAPAL